MKTHNMKDLKKQDVCDRRQPVSECTSIHDLCCARFFTIDFGGKFMARILADGKTGIYDISDGVYFGMLLGYIQPVSKSTFKVFVRKHLMDWTAKLKYNDCRLFGANTKGPYQ